MASKKKSMTPAVRHLRYDVTNSANAGTETSHFIDLARDLSAINRRLYRQGRTYHVKRITVVSRDTLAFGNFADNFVGANVLYQQNAGRISFSTAPNFWVVRGAWKRGFKTFNLMNKEVTRNLTNNIAGKWADFKVYLSNDHYNSANALEFIDNGGNTVSLGEWNYSDFVSFDGTTSDDTFRIHLLGDHVAGGGGGDTWASAGLIQSYGATRATVDFDQPNVPGTASDDPLLNVFDYGTTIDEVIDKLEADNDNPPYSIADYPGASVNMPKPIVMVDGTVADGSTTLGGFDALCGLIEVECNSPIENDVFSVLVELSAGHYRGIKSEAI